MMANFTRKKHSNATDISGATINQPVLEQLTHNISVSEAIKDFLTDKKL